MRPHVCGHVVCVHIHNRKHRADCAVLSLACRPLFNELALLFPDELESIMPQNIHLFLVAEVLVVLDQFPHLLQRITLSQREWIVRAQHNAVFPADTDQIIECIVIVYQRVHPKLAQIRIRFVFIAGNVDLNQIGSALISVIDPTDSVSKGPSAVSKAKLERREFVENPTKHQRADCPR